MRRLVPLSILLTSILIVSIIPGALAADLDLEKDLLHNLAATRAIILKLEQGQATQADLDQLQALVEECRATHLLLEERFRQRDERTHSLGSKARNRHDRMRDRYRDALEEYLGLMEGLVQEGGASPKVLELIKERIDQISPKKPRPIYGSLPYRNLNYAAQEPLLEPLVIPAYRGGDKAVSPDDTTDTPEAPLSEEIAALAESLDWNPVSLYEWVKNNIETEWYWGCMKGAEETLRQKSGNACDQAALLVALLRASGFPARYVRGVIEFFPDIEIAKNLTGIADERELAAFFQKAGIPSKPVIAGGRIANIQMEHVWVETYVPYANYRGAIIDEHGKTWLALDTALKVAGYTVNEPEPLPDQVSLADLRQGYLAGVQDVTPLEYLRAQIEAVLPAGTVYADLLTKRQLVPEELKILPASLQFKEIAITGEYTQIPDELFHKVRFIAKDSNNSELLNFELSTFELSNKSIALTYEPETVEDQEIINSWGGLGNTPSYLIHLRPVLTVDGERVGVGKDGLSVGMEYDLTLELISPNNETELITNTHIIGNLAVIGIVAQGAVVPEEIPFEEKDAQRLLFEQAISYIASWNQAEAELAFLMGLTLARPVPTVVTLGGVVEVTYLLDAPHGFEWQGIYVDADLRAIEVAMGSGQGGASEDEVIFMQLSSLQGSVLEHQVLQDAFQVESVSTAKLFGLANTSGVPIITIDSANIEDVLPTLPFADNVKEDITDAVNQGFICRIPEAEIIYEDWTGIGYIKEDPDTGEAGWMLSGMIAGGSTAQNILDWLEDFLYRFLYPNTEPPNENPEAAYSIHKIPATDRQEGTVGEPLEKTLQVLVLDKDTNAVEGAEVTFTVKAGGGTLKDDETESQTTLTVTTNRNGIAEVELILGKQTSTNPTFWWEKGYTYSQRVGENIVDASLVTGTGAALTTPFVAYGFPDEDTAKVSKLYGDGQTRDILSFAGFISVMVDDKHANPISNKTVEFVATDVSKQCVSEDETRLSALLVKGGDPCMKGIPSYGTCSGSSGAGKKLEVITGHTGAAVQIFTGAVPGADYPIKATCAEAPVNKTVTFHLHSNAFGNCDGNSKPSNRLQLVSVHPADKYGRNINAGAVGSTLELRARMYFLREGETTKEIDIPCEGNTGKCTKIVGSKEYSEDTLFQTASVTFGDESDTEPEANGIFSAQYTLKAGVNTINIHGTATAATKKKWTQTGCDGANMICNPMETDLTDTTGTVQMTVYGVAITTDPKVLIPIDEFGFTIADVPITYTIAPSEYQAATAYMVILKDEEPITYIPAETKGGGTATLSRGFWFDLTGNKYEAQVVLNAGSGVEIRSGKITLDLAHIYMEKEDPDVKLRWNDYYPPLGDKTIVIRGKDGKGNDLNSNKIKAEVVYPTDNINVSLLPAAATEGITFKDGKVEVKLSARNVAPPKEGEPISGLILDRVEIKFIIISDDDKEVGELSGKWNIKNNSNTTLGEVLAGEAVFVYDESGEANHVGKTEEDVTDDKDKKVDFVQELLNQVIPRKRSVGNNNYALMDEKNGIFDDVVRNAIALFKQSQHFNVNNNTINEGENSFNKIKKDYALTDSNSIIDKETLVGVFQRDTDVLINGTPGSLDDTGLYELYENVVKKFVEEMIEEAERYKDATGFQNSENNWKPRTYPNHPAQTVGVSYCFGGKDSLNEFNTTVTKCQVESTTAIRGRENDGIQNNEYRGNIEDNNCVVGTGNKDWPGLINDEYDLWYDDPNDPDDVFGIMAFAPQYWAGIDCSGLVQRSVENGKAVADGLSITIPSPPNWRTSQQIVTENNYRNVYYLENPTEPSDSLEVRKKLKKGDLVRYSGHISIVYSDRWGDSLYDTNTYPDIEYDIIHACGLNSYHGEFARKVRITGNDIIGSSGNIIQPSGFGRIKLWQ